MYRLKAFWWHHSSWSVIEIVFVCTFLLDEMESVNFSLLWRQCLIFSLRETRPTINRKSWLVHRWTRVTLDKYFTDFAQIQIYVQVNLDDVMSDVLEIKILIVYLRHLIWWIFPSIHSQHVNVYLTWHCLIKIVCVFDCQVLAQITMNGLNAGKYRKAVKPTMSGEK